MAFTTSSKERQRIIDVMQQCEDLLKENDLSGAVFLMENVRKNNQQPLAFLRIVLGKDAAVEFPLVQSLLNSEEGETRYLDVSKDRKERTMHALMEIARGARYISSVGIDLFLGFVPPDTREQVRKNLERFTSITVKPEDSVYRKTQEEQLLAD